MSVSVDFASPENLSHSFRLTQQLRHLPASQEVGEDRLQVKNVIYHSVKNALSVLTAANGGGGE